MFIWLLRVGNKLLKLYMIIIFYFLMDIVYFLFNKYYFGILNNLVYFYELLICCLYDLINII